MQFYILPTPRTQGFLTSACPYYSFCWGAQRFLSVHGVAQISSGSDGTDQWPDLFSLH